MAQPEEDLRGMSTIRRLSAASLFDGTGDRLHPLNEAHPRFGTNFQLD
jgi:hypothetical protein